MDSRIKLAGTQAYLKTAQSRHTRQGKLVRAKGNSQKRSKSWIKGREKGAVHDKCHSKNTDP